jgi:hypothetical protein
MENKEYYINCLKELRDDCQSIQVRWSGEESGNREDNAHTAQEIEVKVGEILNLISNI